MLFSSKNIVEAKNDVSFFQAGIQEDVKLESAEIKETPAGKRLIEVTFSKGGAKLTSSEWEPERFADETDKRFATRCTGFLSRLTDMLMPFYPKEALTIEVDSFAQLAQWFVKMVNAADKTKLVRIKCVYNKNGYVVLAPGYLYTFIEPMTIKAEDSKIRILSKDVIERPKKEVDNIEELKTAPETQSQAANDALPF